MQPLPRVRRLPTELANQIAAGEVVERPASVVKELVENSLDAGANEVVIEAEEGGVRLLRVRDDGGGIHKEDLALALSRHATSKIQSTRDLLGITSLGFRGEALASIASVARLQLTSRRRDSDNAWSLAGENDTPAPAAHPSGTTIEVRDLFYNLPARRKFLRAERTEYEHLEETVRRLALGHFDVAFTLRHNGRAIFSVPPAQETSQRERRLAALIGRPFLENAAAIEFEAAGLKLHGWIGARGYSRSQQDVQYVYLNGRAIRDRVVAHALRQGFGETIPEGRFAAYVLYLEMEPAQVDVNVHPTKHEVRFREARLVHDFLVSALRSAVGEAQSWSPPTHAAPRHEVAEASGAYEAFKQLAEPPKRRETKSSGNRPLLLLGRFLLVESEEGTLLIDALRFVQQQTHEVLVSALATGSIAMRPLLIPATVRVGAQAADEAERAGERLRRVGVDISLVSGEAVRLLGVPDGEASFEAELLVKSVLNACAQQLGDESLLSAIAQAARLPGEGEWPELIVRARERRGFAVPLDAERLARLVREGA